MSKQIPLTQGKFATVDDEDYDRLMKYKWCARIRDDGAAWYACRKEIVDGKHHQQQMHRFILDAPNGMLCDHVNGNGLDNRRVNLRLATPKQNTMNRGANRNHIGFKGVTHIKPGKFQAQIKVDGKFIYLGLFDNARSAAIAYNIAAEKYHGEFARLNVIPK